MMANNHTNGYRDPDTFDVRASLRTIYDAVRLHRGLVLLTCVLTLGLVTYYVYAWPPIYRVQSMLMIERDYDVARDAFYVGWNVFRKDDAKTELELLMAGPIMLEVVEKEKLTYDDVYHPFLSHLTYLWEKSWIGRTYRAFKRKLFPEDPDVPTPAQLEVAKTVNDMRAGISVEALGESNAGRLTVKGPSRRVANIANTLMDVYLARRVERHQMEAEKSLAILTEQVARAGREAKEVENRRAALARENSLIIDFQKEGLEIDKLTELEFQIASARMKVAVLEASIREIEKQLEMEPPTKTTSMVFEINALRETTKMKRLELQTALIQVRERYREDSPEVQEIKNSLAKLDKMIAESSEKVEKATTEGLNSVRQELISKRSGLRADLEGSRAGLAVMEETATKLRARLSEVPTMQATMRAVDRDLAASAEQYKELLAKHAQAVATVATTKSTMPSLRIVEYASPPSAKWWPKLKYLYPAALILGLLLGVCAALLRNLFSGRVRREHVESGRGTTPLYGAIAVSTHGRPLAVVPRENIAKIASLGRSEG